MDKDTQQLLTRIAQQLETWSRESRSGGWSTHQCGPQESLAQEIWAFIGRRTYQQENPQCPKVS